MTADITATAPRDLAGGLAAQRERSRAQVAQYHQIRAALENLRVRATSRDRGVTVELAAGGAIVDLRLTDQAMHTTPEALAKTILDTIRQGVAEVAQRTAESVQPLTGHRVDVSAIAQGRLPSLHMDNDPGAEQSEQSRFDPEED